MDDDTIVGAPVSPALYFPRPDGQSKAVSRHRHGMRTVPFAFFGGVSGPPRASLVIALLTTSSNVGMMLCSSGPPRLALGVGDAN